MVLTAGSGIGCRQPARQLCDLSDEQRPLRGLLLRVESEHDLVHGPPAFPALEPAQVVTGEQLTLAA